MIDASRDMAKAASHIILATLSVAFCTGCSGNARPDAIVTEVNGSPCFGIPDNRETRGGIPLYGLLVSQRHAATSDAKSGELWSVSVEPAGASIVARPGSCIQYGVAPDGAQAGKALALQTYQVYGIDINARPEDSDIHSYSAEFCIKLSASGKALVQVVPWDEKSKQWKYGVCART